LADLAMTLGGHATEQMVFNEITTGASNDLKVATALARKLVMVYGMSDLGPMTFGSSQEMVFLGRELSESKNYSEKVAAKIDEEIAGFIDRAYKTASEAVRKHRKHLNLIAKELMEKETIERGEFERLVADIIPASKLQKIATTEVSATS